MLALQHSCEIAQGQMYWINEGCSIIVSNNLITGQYEYPKLRDFRI